MRWASGYVFDGSWSNGLKRFGVYRFASGDVYNGEFKSDIFHGKNKSIVKQVKKKSSRIWIFLKTFKSKLELILQLCSR